MGIFFTSTVTVGAEGSLRKSSSSFLKPGRENTDELFRKFRIFATWSESSVGSVCALTTTLLKKAPKSGSVPSALAMGRQISAAAQVVTSAKMYSGSSTMLDVSII